MLMRLIDVLCERGLMAQSCKKCGFFVNTPSASTGHIGYCLFFRIEQMEKTGQKFRIKVSEEDKLAETCEGYFNNADCFKS